MRAQVQLFAGKQSYARSGTCYAWGDEVIRTQNDLCVGKQSYKRSERFMRGETKLYALRTIYARGVEIRVTTYCSNISILKLISIIRDRIVNK